MKKLEIRLTRTQLEKNVLTLIKIKDIPLEQIAKNIVDNLNQLKNYQGDSKEIEEAEKSYQKYFGLIKECYPKLFAEMGKYQ